MHVNPVKSTAQQLQMQAHPQVMAWDRRALTGSCILCAHLKSRRQTVSKLAEYWCNAGTPEDALRLNPQVLAGIYSCRITSWQDPAIVALNPSLS